ncbi:inositol monophosphatase family protein [Corynebacterium caspium]|uniref:inositol monophosphatase family protein n=1 Tax=Corynebacterium caspium TaxID=234828 RepID=UPI00036898A3|nr:inositol monophosphatase [Corynebacterium caspium]WKD59031.1 Inositol-1-monophosphatase ImpA [Corynebacterium caspium DSM 44850]
MPINAVPEFEWGQILTAIAKPLAVAETMFISGLGAKPVHPKGPQDFATDIDLEIEAFLRTELCEKTGYPVLGEEFGGICYQEDFSWMVDPVDGTTNFSTGSPLCAILIALLYKSQPIGAIISMPFLEKRLSAGYGQGLYINGKPAARRRKWDSRNGQIAFSSLVPGQLLENFENLGLRPRITGSVGVSLAFATTGIVDAAISFSPHPWDNAAGALAAREAGLQVTTAGGQPWNVNSPNLVVAAPEIHDLVIAELIAANCADSQQQSS